MVAFLTKIISEIVLAMSTGVFCVFFFFFFFLFPFISFPVSPFYFFWIVDGVLVICDIVPPSNKTPWVAEFRLQVSGFFPDDFVESPSLFKRGGRYYVTYGSCCCGCQEGGTATGTATGTLAHHFGPSPACFPASRRPTRAVCDALLGVHLDRLVIGAWNPML